MEQQFYDIETLLTLFLWFNIDWVCDIPPIHADYDIIQQHDDYIEEIQELLGIIK